MNSLDTLRQRPFPMVKDYSIAQATPRPIFHYSPPWLECEIIYAIRNFDTWVLVVGSSDGSYDWVTIRDNNTVLAHSDSAYGVAAEALHAGMDAAFPDRSMAEPVPSETGTGKESPDPRQIILAALRNDKPTRSSSLTPLENDRVVMIYRRAVLAVCRAIEESATPADLASAGVPLEDLTPQHRIGEHLSATRRHFGLIP